MHELDSVDDSFSVGIPHMSTSEYRFGIIYIATGKDYIQEATNSALSAHKVMPEVPVVIYTDQSPPELSKTLFKKVVTIEKPTFSFCDKIHPLVNSPFERTLFLDTDTVLLHPVSELFQIFRSI